MQDRIKNSKFWWLVFAVAVVLFIAIGSISSVPGRPKWVYDVVGSITFVCMLAAVVSLVIAVVLTRNERRRKRSIEFYNAGIKAMSDGDWALAKEQFLQANSNGHSDSDAKLDEVIKLEAAEYYENGLQAMSNNDRDEAKTWFVKAKVWEHPGADAKLAEIKVS